MIQQNDEAEQTLWCGNLHDKVTEELLYELFLQVCDKLTTNEGFLAADVHSFHAVCLKDDVTGDVTLHTRVNGRRRR